MNLTDKPAGHDANEDVRRLIDAGYSVTLTAAPAGYDTPAYMASITSESGSRWRGVDSTPGGALRSVWPLGYGPGQGGCGHCCMMGCDGADCPVCSAYGPVVAGRCGVCGYTEGPATCECGHAGAGHPMRIADATFPCSQCGCADFELAAADADGEDQDQDGEPRLSLATVTDLMSVVWDDGFRYGQMPAAEREGLAGRKAAAVAAAEQAAESAGDAR